MRSPLAHVAVIVALALGLAWPAAAGRKAPPKFDRSKASPAQVWSIVTDAYLRKDFKTLYQQWSGEDRKKEPYARFKAKLERDYDKKVGAFRALKFVAGPVAKGPDGRSYASFHFLLDGKRKRGGRMLREPDGWRLYRFH